MASRPKRILPLPKVKATSRASATKPRASAKKSSMKPRARGRTFKNTEEEDEDEDDNEDKLDDIVDVEEEEEEDMGTHITNQFMMILAIETAKLLETEEAQKELKKIVWQINEANTDKGFSDVASLYCEQAWLVLRDQHLQLRDITMTAVGPDINCTFTIDDEIISKKKIELKSSKSREILGSTSSKLNVNQPVIWCLRYVDTRIPCEIRCGQYHTAMSKSDFLRFQDRTPRVPIEFDQLPLLSSYDSSQIPYSEESNTGWIKKFALSALNRLESPSYKSWQEKLIRDILLETLDHVTTEEQLETLKESLRMGKGTGFGKKIISATSVLDSIAADAASVDGLSSVVRFCEWKFAVGKQKGELCGKPTALGSTLCNKHKIKR